MAEPGFAGGGNRVGEQRLSSELANVFSRRPFRSAPRRNDDHESAAHLPSPTLTALSMSAILDAEAKAGRENIVSDGHPFSVGSNRHLAFLDSYDVRDSNVNLRFPRWAGDMPAMPLSLHGNGRNL
jgi:hypothetical protein